MSAAPLTKRRLRRGSGAWLKARRLHGGKLIRLKGGQKLGLLARG